MFRLYIGNLPYRVRGEDLRKFFESCGAVKDATVILDADHRSKGFGFVEFEDEAGFKKGLEMNGQEMEGRALRINEARPREDGGAPRPAMDQPKAAPMEEAEMPSMDEEAPAAPVADADSEEEEDEDEAEGDDDDDSEEESDEEDAKKDEE